MEWKIADDILLIHMGPGEDLVGSMKEAFMGSGARSAVVLSSIGQVSNVELGYYVKRGDYSPTRFKGPLELLGISGIISMVDGDPFPHFHIWLGDREKRVHGGHLIRADVTVTNESVLKLMDIDIKRAENNGTGLLDLSP